MKRQFARRTAQIGMFVFIIVLADVLHPYLIRFNGDLVWIISFLVVLGLLLLPGWLFDRRQKPARAKIVKVHRSIPLPGGGQLFVSSSGVGPMDGFKGFRTDAIFDPQPQGARSQPAVISPARRWLLALPCAAFTYLLVIVVLVGVVGDRTWNTVGVAGFTGLFALAMLAAVLAGALTAPARRVQVACVLVLVLAAAFVFLTARAAPSGLRDTSLPPVVLGQVAAGRLAALWVWWRERRRTAARR